MEYDTQVLQITVNNLNKLETFELASNISIITSNYSFKFLLACITESGRYTCKLFQGFIADGKNE